LCKKESLDLNKAFIHRNTTKRAFGVLKWAMSIDGRIALKNGKSKWITNDESRSLVHSFRAEFDAIIIGGNTLRRDNPLLTTRGSKNPEPLRVVFTKSLNLPSISNLWDCSKAKTLVIYDSSTANESYLSRIPKCVEVEKVLSDNPELISKILAKRGCNKVLWECGPRLATAAIKSNCIQELITFIAPKILGGENSMNPLCDFEFKEMHEIIKLSSNSLAKGVSIEQITTSIKSLNNPSKCEKPKRKELSVITPIYSTDSQEINFFDRGLSILAEGKANIESNNVNPWFDPNQKIKVRLRYFGIEEWHEGILPFSVKLQFENNVAVINFENSEIRGSIYSSVKICT